MEVRYFGLIFFENNDFTFSGSTYLKSCIAFKLNANQLNGEIITIADMNYPRCKHSLLSANGKLYAIGGYIFIEYLTLVDSYIYFSHSDSNWKEKVPFIEEYDPIQNKWRIVSTYY